MELKIETNLTLGKEEIYRQLVPQIEALIAPEKNLIANLANVCAVLKETFQFLWVGFYLLEENELVLGPFQGPIACTRIAIGRGVCGKAFKNRSTIVVPDVDLFEDHIACSSLSKSEIVVPMLKNDHAYGVLDIDSDQLNTFDAIDQKYLELIVELLNSKR